jgi:GntR family transcriptional regulator
MGGVSELMIRPLDKKDSRPLYAQVSERLVEYIKESGLAPGDPLPSQNELINQLNVSAITVRHALQRLATEGHIYSRQGRGTFVAEKKLSLSPDNIIPFEEQMVTQGVEFQNELLDETMVHPIDKHRLELQLPEGSQAYKVIRIKRIGGKSICVENNHLPPEFQGRYTTGEITNQPFIKLFSSDPETKVTDIDYTIKSVLLLQREADFLDVPIDTPALVQHRVIYSNTKPLLAGRLVYLADKIEIRFRASNSISTTLHQAKLKND